MKTITPAVLAAITLLFVCASTAPSARRSNPRPLTLPLQCEGGYCVLLGGAPQTAGMRSGLVRLKAGDSIGEHTTGKNEESLVVLRGQGEAQVEGHPALPFTAPAIVYIPSGSKHNVTNTGSELLEYVYVVAPARAP